MNKQLNNLDGSIVYMCAKDKVIIDFCQDEKEPSELLELKFVVDSYFESCCVLLQQVKKYQHAKNFQTQKKYILKYLPAFFCFRHYVELKMKYLYMLYTRNTCPTTHDLTNLKTQLCDATGCRFDIFSKAISFIERNEHVDENARCVEYSRYLADRNFNFANSVSVDMDEVAEMLERIIEIEGRFRDQEQVEEFSNMLKNSQKE